MTSWVLIVDDEEMIRENLKAYLEDEGLGVAAFESAIRTETHSITTRDRNGLFGRVSWAEFLISYNNC